MAFPDSNEPSAQAIDDLELVNALIERKEAGEPVDPDILALLTDIWSGLLLEAWQVQRFVGVRLLGEVEEP